MPKLFQKKSLLKSIQIFLVCLVVLGGVGNIKNVEAEVGDTWKEVTDDAAWAPKIMPNQAVVFNDEMWIIGNYGDASPRASWYSTDGISWNEVTSTGENWSGRYEYNILVFNDELVMIGGRSDLFFFENILVSNNGINWTEVTSDGGYPRSDFASVVFDGKMWITGGCESYTDTTCDLTRSVVSSPNGIDWTVVGGTGGSPRRDHSMVVFDDKMWIMGGWSLNDVWYSSDGIDWTELTPADGIWRERWGHSSVVFDNKIWVMGGRGGDGSDYYNDVWYLDLADIDYGTNTGTWHQVAIDGDMWQERYMHGALVFDNEMWVMGGGDRFVNLDDVWRTDTIWPPPTCVLTASDTTIHESDSVDLIWSSTNADTVVSSNFGAGDVNGSATIFPTSAITYELNISGEGGTGSCSSAKVSVFKPPRARDLWIMDKLVKDIVKDAIDWAVNILAIIAILMVVVGGVALIFSSGDPRKAAFAKKIILWALGGLTIVGISYAMIVLVEKITMG